ncbi:MAG: hypothetical protein WC662_03365 [Candidatus Paceibacterota bacterium]|jgi:hypothetical protein
MKENIETENLISEEQKKLQRDMEVVMFTEGFSRLTKKQQQIIKQSLYLQIRATRKDDNGPHGYRYDPKYQNSRDYVAEMNCHAAILSLEKEQSLKSFSQAEIKENLDNDFFIADYIYVDKINKLKEKAEKFGFPCVVHIKSPLDRPIRADVYHSFLVLGHNKENKIVIWDKAGFEVSHPYRIKTIDNIFDNYGDCSDWGFRKLRSKINI